ncbi:hypothetical protein C4K14_1438 [Pseudomonas chlororaphis subsp. aureofaciens]|nr:hypothetical protein C4K14_1438 [Pseudomonas chlororaphis subsp. aureofaciens]
MKRHRLRTQLFDLTHNLMGCLCLGAVMDADKCGAFSGKPLDDGSADSP